MKSIVDGGHTIRNFHARQSCAIKKSIVDRGHTIRNINARQSGAITKSIIADCGYAIGDFNVCQSCALIKCIFFNRRYTLRHRILRVAKLILQKCGFILIKQHAVNGRIYRIGFIYRKGKSAPHKCVIMELSQTRGKVDRFERNTVIKRQSTNCLKPLV